MPDFIGRRFNPRRRDIETTSCDDGHLKQIHRLRIAVNVKLIGWGIRMRTHGNLIKWNDERGFGFIEPSAGTEVIFVHISAFPRDGGRPCVGEFISFDVEQRDDGNKRARRVMRPGTRASCARRTDRTRAAAHGSSVAAIAGLLLLAALGGYAYTQFTTGRTPSPTPVIHSMARPTQTVSETLFTCDGRNRCSQMTSCAEATYFTKQCPGTQMDGDGDGVPCETQWYRSDQAN